LKTCRLQADRLEGKTALKTKAIIIFSISVSKE
jgi:hypothetical protein